MELSIPVSCEHPLHPGWAVILGTVDLHQEATDATVASSCVDNIIIYYLCMFMVLVFPIKFDIRIRIPF